MKRVALQEYYKSVLPILRLHKGRDRLTILDVVSTAPACSPSYPNTAKESLRGVQLQAHFLRS